MSKVTIGIGRQPRNHSLEELRRHRVITRRNINVFACCIPEALVPCRVWAFARSLKNANSSILLRKILNQFPRSIIGVAVINKQFPILQCLPQDGVKSLFQEGTRVQVWKADRNKWCHGSLRSPRTPWLVFCHGPSPP